MSGKPHLLHLAFDEKWGPIWRLECPYSATEIDNPPGRPCRLVNENTEPRPVEPEPEAPQWAWDAFYEAEDEYETWISTPGCFASQYMDESGEWTETLRLTAADPSFPVQVDIEIEGAEEDAYVSAIVPFRAGPLTGEGDDGA